MGMGMLGSILGGFLFGVFGLTAPGLVGSRPHAACPNTWPNVAMMTE